MESTESTGSTLSVARKAASFLWMYALVLVLALVVLGIGIYQVADGGRNYAMLAAGMVSVIAVLLVWLFNINLKAAREEEIRKWDETLGPVNERLQYISVLLNQVSEQQLISERAKGIVQLQYVVHEHPASQEAALARQRLKQLGIESK